MIQTTKKTAWTPERRAKQAAAVKLWAPWAKSTGPKTRAGKRTSSQNARKHYDAPMKKALRAQSLYLADIKAFYRARDFSAQNELLKKHLRNRRRTLLRRGNNVTRMLRLALIDNIMQKTCFFPPPAANS